MRYDTENPDSQPRPLDRPLCPLLSDTLPESYADGSQDATKSLFEARYACVHRYMHAVAGLGDMSYDVCGSLRVVM